MPEQQSIDVNSLREQQLELERWCRNIGRQKACADGWEKGAQGSLINKLAESYLKAVRQAWESRKKRAGKQAHIWALMPEWEPAQQVALEAFFYAISHCHDAQSANKMARGIGTRAEYALWLAHKSWGGSLHLKGLKLVAGSSLSMDLMVQRLKDKGFRKAAAYKPLEPIEKTALGMLFLELIAASTGLLELFIEKGAMGRKKKMVRMTELYWGYLDNWIEIIQWLKPLRLPMLVPPKPWTGHHDGGYLMIESQVTPVAWERWPEVIKQAKPCVLGSINALQEVPYVIDHEMADLLASVWGLGHPIGKVPRRERLPEPIDHEYKVRGLGPSAYWKAVWEYKADRRLNGGRSQVINSLVTYTKLCDAEKLYFVWRMDHRGRLYSRGAHLNPQSADHFRAQLQFAETSPMKGNEAAFAWSLGEAYGEAKDEKVRIDFLHDERAVIAAAGRNPPDYLEFFDRAKEPFRFAQLCMDWACYQDNPAFRTGTIHWLDQTCSGWGHLACLTGDHDLAQFTNVVGSRPADLYQGIGHVVEQRIQWRLEHDVLNDRQRGCLTWWKEHEIPRSLWKKMLMPVIYGRTYLSLAQTVREYLRDDIKDFLTDEGLRVVDLANNMATVVSAVIKDVFPHVRDLSHWLGKLADLQMDKGIRPCWLTPNMMLVESYSNVTYDVHLELAVAGRRVSIRQRDQDKTKLNRRGTKRKLVPDFIHSLDAAFLQRFVCHWQAYGHPLSVVHDCFGTTLGAVKTLRSELNDQWARFYSVDYLTRHQGAVSIMTGMDAPAPPAVGTLDRSLVGENPYLFC